MHIGASLFFLAFSCYLINGCNSLNKQSLPRLVHLFLFGIALVLLLLYVLLSYFISLLDKFCKLPVFME